MKAGCATRFLTPQESSNPVFKKKSQFYNAWHRACPYTCRTEYWSQRAMPVRTASAPYNVKKDSRGHFWAGHSHPPQAAAGLGEIRLPLTNPSGFRPALTVHWSPLTQPHGSRGVTVCISPHTQGRALHLARQGPVTGTENRCAQSGAGPSEADRPRAASGAPRVATWLCYPDTSQGER